MNYNVITTVVNSVLQRSEKSPIIIAIDGPSASGKTQLAQTIAQNFDCNIFHMDDFFLSPERKTPQRLSTPGGNVDYERFEQEVLQKLDESTSFCYDKYSCQTGQKTPAGQITPKRLNIIEGVYSMHPNLLKYYDYTIFLDVTREKQLQRILQRSNEFMLNRFEKEWIPLEDLYFETLELRKNAKLVIDTTKIF